MNFDFATEPEIRRELGRRIAQQRIKKNMTQFELAYKSNVGIATVKRLESGEGATLSNFIRVLMSLRLVNELADLAVEPTLTIAAFEAMSANQRKRVYHRKEPK
jgi:transcriptional regulator with XRE-family HTH domain